jgi:proline racemase/trans-L-3-hydroxyproline dehydratase
MARFTHIISTVDTHTAGEPTRIVLSGLPPILGTTMAVKKRYMMEHLDHFRTLLMQEPRGHRDMVGAILTPPTTERSAYGILFMDHAGYLDMCGHATIGITTALATTGMIPLSEPETVVIFDTSAGSIESHARVERHEVVEVSVANVSSFLYAKDVALHLPDLGAISIDVSFAGNFIALARARDLGVSVHADHVAKLLELGTLVKTAVNARLQVYHPTQPHLTTVQLTQIYDQPEPPRPFARSIAIFGSGQMDRSPCGTGTSALMATLYVRGELPLGVQFINESIIGTRFSGRLIREVQVGEFVAVDPIFTGQAYLTGMHQFVVDPNDPAKYGFVVGR